MAKLVDHGDFAVIQRLQAGLFVVAVALSASCSGDTGQPDTVADTAMPRPWATGAAVTAALEATSGDDVFLSYVWDVATDSQGNVLVVDGSEAAIIALNPDLTHNRLIGREGEGPGEFGRPAQVQVLAGDSVLVWDSQLQRITVFPSGAAEPAYVQLLGTQERAISVWRLAGSAGHIARSSTAYMADGSDEGSTRTTVLRHVHEADGRVADQVLFDYPAGEALVQRGEGFVSMAGHPFGRESFAGILAGDRIVHTSSDALEMRILNLGGQVETTLSYETTPIPVTRSELDAAADGLSDAFGQLLRDGAPYVWPALTGMVVDDRDRIWVGIRRADRSTTEWAAFEADGTHQVSVDLPVEVDLYAVRGDRVVGVARDELDVARVVVYRLP
ncbi:MAG: hypothetical protein OXN18_14590 [Gemmatimonadota bacterium]|nr:hypothetical protein [Gemmatimonadota bacterium]